MDEPDLAYKFTYNGYFSEILLSVKLFRKGLQAELAQTSAKDPKFAAVQSIVKQADQYVAKIEKEADKYMQQADKIYKKPPRSILDPTGKALDKFLLKHQQQSANSSVR